MRRFVSSSVLLIFAAFLRMLATTFRLSPAAEPRWKTQKSHHLGRPCRYLQVIVGLPRLGSFLWTPPSRFHTMQNQAIFTLLSPFLSCICHTTAVGEPEANQLPPSVAAQGDVNYSTLRRGRKKWGRMVEPSWLLLETIRSRFPQEVQLHFNHETVIFRELKTASGQTVISGTKQDLFIFHIKKRSCANES